MLSASEKIFAVQEIIYRNSLAQLRESGIDSVLSAVVMQGVLSRFCIDALLDVTLSKARNEAEEKHTGTPEELLRSLKEDDSTS